MKVLILTGNFGMGHVSAAAAAKEEIENTFIGAQADVVDLVDYMFPTLNVMVYGAFNLLASKCHGLYNKLNKIGGKDSLIVFADRFTKKFEMLLNEYVPDIIISTWPVGSRYLGAYKKMTGNTIPYITCITDISAHNEWLSERTTAYIVGDESSRQEMMYKGIAGEKIFVGGIPVKEQFKKASHRIEIAQKEVLIMGGGLGLIPEIDEILSAIDSMRGIHAIVITGNNKKLYNSLDGKYSNADIIGYTDRVAEYMQASDLIISKPGGITMFEAIYTETPILVPTPFLQQEKDNAAFIERKGIGRVIAADEKDYGSILKDMLDCELEMASMCKNMHEIKVQIKDNNLSQVMAHIGVVA